MNSISGYTISLADKIAPEIVMWNHDNDDNTADIPKVIGIKDLAIPEVNSNDFNVTQSTTPSSITIHFSEDIDESTLTLDTFSVTGFTITDISAPACSKTIVLTVEPSADNALDYTSDKIYVTQNLDIYDRAGNAFVHGSTWEVTWRGIHNQPVTN